MGPIRFPDTVQGESLHVRPNTSSRSHLSCPSSMILIFTAMCPSEPAPPPPLPPLNVHWMGWGLEDVELSQVGEVIGQESSIGGGGGGQEDITVFPVNDLDQHIVVKIKTICNGYITENSLLIWLTISSQLWMSNKFICCLYLTCPPLLTPSTARFTLKTTFGIFWRCSVLVSVISFWSNSGRHCQCCVLCSCGLELRCSSVCGCWSFFCFYCVRLSMQLLTVTSCFFFFVSLHWFLCGYWIENPKFVFTHRWPRQKAPNYAVFFSQLKWKCQAQLSHNIWKSVWRRRRKKGFLFVYF